MYVNDLDLFVTAQIFKDTPAVVSLGKLCEDHGYPCEWTRGQKTGLIKKRQVITMQRGELRAYRFFLGLSTGPSGSSSSTSSTSVSQDSTRDDSTPPANTRSRSTRSRARGSPLRDLREWLEDFAENWLDEEASASSEAPASISREPLHQEPPIKVASGKHSIFIHYPKDRNCPVRKRTKITRVLAANALGIKCLEQESLVTGQQHITKFSEKNVNLETVTDMQSWCKIRLLNVCHRIRATQNLLRKPKRKSFQKFLEPTAKVIKC